MPKPTTEKRIRERVFPALLLLRIIDVQRGDTAECQQLCADLSDWINAASTPDVSRQARIIVDGVIKNCDQRSTATLVNAYIGLVNKLIDTSYPPVDDVVAFIERVFGLVNDEESNAAPLLGSARSGGKLGERWYDYVRRQGLYRPMEMAA